MAVNRKPGRVALVRAEPGSSAARRAVEAVRDWLGQAPGQETVLVFCHGAGVDQAAQADDPWPALGAELKVCETAWRRRYAAPPPEPWTAGSLVEFWAAADAANCVECFAPGLFMTRSAGTTPGPASGPSRDAGGMNEPGCTVSGAFLLEIGFAPAEPDAREALELALGAAALELPLEVLFVDEGLGHLRGAPARGWRQLTDHRLAGVHAYGAPDPEPELPAQWYDEAGAEALRRSARRVLRL